MYVSGGRLRIPSTRLQDSLYLLQDHDSSFLSLNELSLPKIDTVYEGTVYEGTCVHMITHVQYIL